MIIDCIGCLHGFFPDLKGGDILIVTGDLTARDKYKEYIEFNSWLLRQNYSKKILISGNHDNWIFESPMMKDTFYDCEYLCDSGIEFEGLKIWGSPWTKKFEGQNPKAMAFTLDTDEEMVAKWELIPKKTDILVTHTPPYGLLDGIPVEDGSLFHAGCHSLRDKVFLMSPKLHVFSHIHECGGKKIQTTLSRFVNCSYVNERYWPVNKPIRITLDA